MKVGFQDFSPNVPRKNHYESGVDYLWHDFDLELEDVLYLINQLKRNRSSVIIYAPSAIVDFHIFDNALHVQIDGDGFWCASDIDSQIIKEILKATYEGCGHFGSQIPGANREWDAYCI